MSTLVRAIAIVGLLSCNSMHGMTKMASAAAGTASAAAGTASAVADDLLFVAARDGDEPLVTGLIDSLAAQGTDINSIVQASTGDTPLHAAARGNYSSVIERLRTANANINACNHLGNSPLLVAAKKGHLEACERLLRTPSHLGMAPVNLDLPNNAGETPLFIAAKQRHVGVVRKLLDARADKNLACLTGETPLVVAACYGHEDVVEQLVSADASIDPFTGCGRTALLVATLQDRNDIVEPLLRRAVDVNQFVYANCQPLLYFAATYNSMRVAQLLLDRHANINQGAPVYTPLYSVLSKGDSTYDGMFDLLIANGAVADTWPDGGLPSALHMAANKGNLHMVTTLVNRDPNDMDRKTGLIDETALFTAAAGGHRDVVEFLILRFVELCRPRQGMVELPCSLLPKTIGKMSLKFCYPRVLMLMHVLMPV